MAFGESLTAPPPSLEQRAASTVVAAATVDAAGAGLTPARRGAGVRQRIGRVVRADQRQALHSLSANQPALPAVRLGPAQPSGPPAGRLRGRTGPPVGTT